MRALGDPDAFPASDLGVLHALRALGAEADAREVGAPLAAPGGRSAPTPCMHLWGALEPAATA